jgi:signal transduction histidine kinase
VRRRLLLGFVLFAFLAMVLLVIPVGYTLDTNENSSTLSALRRDTSALATLLASDIAHDHLAQAGRFARTYSRASGRQVLVVQGTTTLVASRPSQVHDDEIATILPRVGTTQLSGVLPRSTQEDAQYYVAQRLPAVSGVRSLAGAVLVVTYPVAVATRAIHNSWKNLALYGLLMLLVAFGLGLVISSSLTRPLRRIARSVDAIGSGHLEVRAPIDEGPPELRQLAEAINATSSRLIDSLDVQRAFVADASHQLRTPLTALQLHLENLQHAGGRASSEEFEAVLAEVSRLRHLVESLLQLARSESGQVVLVAVDLAQVARSRVGFWQPWAEERGLDLAAGGDAVVPSSAVEGAIDQVLDNLLANAFDATARGGSIRVEARLVGAHAELHVVDTGVGLSAQDRVNARRRFWRGRANTAEGSGLGLAIVEQLVRLSGGALELRESPSGGLDVTVTLRRA